ncbi:MAG: hypothetical protein KAS12_07240, partial [Candidatus Aenigmarchaeota archaeon]|nr:hypothetical protein [Candidatus Aenigmarchaeota archaeon]
DKLSKLSKVGLVKFSNETVMLAPQEQQTLFYLYNVQADKKSRATSIKDVVCGLYGSNDQSKTSYISRTMRKLEFMQFIVKKRNGKTTGVWLTKKAVDYCRAALIDRFEGN